MFLTLKDKDLIISLLKDDWCIGTSTHFKGDVYAWMQKGERGCGGESKSVHIGTFRNILKSGILKKVSDNGFGETVYILKND